MNKHQEKKYRAIEARIYELCRKSGVTIVPRANIQPSGKLSRFLFKIAGKWLKVDINTWIELK